MSSTPTDTPCPQCGDWLSTDGTCSTCGARSATQSSTDRPLYPSEVEDDPEDWYDGPDEDPTDPDLDYYADRAADRYERWLFGE